MSPSEIGNNFVTGPEKFVLHLVMDQVYHSSAGMSNVPIFRVIFPETVFALPRVAMAPEQWIYTSIMSMVSPPLHAKYMFISSLWPT